MERGADPVDLDMSTFLVRINDTEDPRKAWASVKQRMEVLRTAGKPVPEVLIKVERQLMADCMAESQGR